MKKVIPVDLKACVGEKLERVGREHKLIYYDGSGKHDSITMSGSRWFDHKNQVGGGAIKFMQEPYDMDFQTCTGIWRYHSLTVRRKFRKNHSTS